MPAIPDYASLAGKIDKWLDNYVALDTRLGAVEDLVKILDDRSASVEEIVKGIDLKVQAHLDGIQAREKASDDRQTALINIIEGKQVAILGAEKKAGEDRSKILDLLKEHAPTVLNKVIIPIVSAVTLLASGGGIVYALMGKAEPAETPVPEPRIPAMPREEDLPDFDKGLDK